MITLVPVGGLGNRMWSIASAWALAYQCQTTLRILWFKDAGLNCSFKELFSLANLPKNISLEEASPYFLATLDRPRRKNLNIPRLFQKLQFADCIYEEDPRLSIENQFDFVRWATNRNVYIATYKRFFFDHNPQQIYKELFTLTPNIDRMTQTITQNFSPHTLGIHIRRTDHIVAIRQSPTQLFINRMQQAIDEEEATTFYVASDDTAVKEELKRHFGKRILTTELDLSRKIGRAHV